MKKGLLISIFIFIAANAFCMEAEVVSTKGKAEVQNENVWIPLKTGDKLSKGAVVQTGFKSELVLKIKETTVTIDPLSRITIEQLAERNGATASDDRDVTKIFLDTGSLKSNVKKSEDKRVSFTVHSQVATAAVRGTELTVRQGYKKTDITTNSGKVAVWKTKNARPSIESDDLPLVGGYSDENSAEAISSEQAQDGAFVSTRGDTVTFEDGGDVVNAERNARKDIAFVNVKGDGPAPAEANKGSNHINSAVTSSNSKKTLSVIIVRSGAD